MCLMCKGMVRFPGVRDHERQFRERVKEEKPVYGRVDLRGGTTVGHGSPWFA